MLFVGGLVLELHLQVFVVLLDEVKLVSEVVKFSDKLINVSFGLQQVDLLSLLRHVLSALSFLIGIDALLGKLGDRCVKLFDFAGDAKDERVALGRDALDLKIALIVGCMSGFASVDCVNLTDFFDPMLVILHFSQPVLHFSLFVLHFSYLILKIFDGIELLAQFFAFALRGLALLIEFHLEVNLYVFYLIDQMIGLLQLFFFVLERIIQTILLSHLFAHVFDVPLFEFFAFDGLDLERLIDAFHLELYFEEFGFALVEIYSHFL